MKSLRLVLAAPWLLLGLSALQLALAAGIAAPVRAVLRAAMSPFTIGDEQQLLGPLFELIAHDPAVSAAMFASLAVAGALGLLLAPLLAGAVITRLAGPANVGEQARASVTHFPAALVIGLYGLILRVLLALVAAALGTLHPALQVVTIAASLGLEAEAGGDRDDLQRGVEGAEGGGDEREQDAEDEAVEADHEGGGEVGDAGAGLFADVGGAGEAGDDGAGEQGREQQAEGAGDGEAGEHGGADGRVVGDEFEQGAEQLLLVADREGAHGGAQDGAHGGGDAGGEGELEGAEAEQQPRRGEDQAQGLHRARPPSRARSTASPRSPTGPLMPSRRSASLVARWLSRRRASRVSLRSGSRRAARTLRPG